MEEQLEFVMICLRCLHVGCTRKKQGHAEQHYQKFPDHPVVRGIVGRLYCYECDQDIEVEEETKSKIAEIQKDFDSAICVPSADLSPSHVCGIFHVVIRCRTGRRKDNLSPNDEAKEFDNRRHRI